jgi:hypothetical protein
MRRLKIGVVAMAVAAPLWRWAGPEDIDDNEILMPALGGLR